jgi:hypothetical protein
VRKNGFHQFGGFGSGAVFDARDRPRDGARFTREDFLKQILGLGHKFVIFSFFAAIFQNCRRFLAESNPNSLIDFDASAKAFPGSVFFRAAEN